MWNPFHNTMKSAGSLTDFRRHVNTPTLFILHIIQIEKDFHYANGHDVAYDVCKLFTRRVPCQPHGSRTSYLLKCRCLVMFQAERPGLKATFSC